MSMLGIQEGRSLTSCTESISAIIDKHRLYMHGQNKRMKAAGEK